MKRKKHKVKTKKQRQQWWADLPDSQRHDYIEGIVKRKGERRRDKSIKIMSKISQKFDCAKCFHGQGRNCIDKLPNGCEHWFNPKGKKVGLAEKNIKKQSLKKWLILIKKKNPWLKVA